MSCELCWLRMISRWRRQQDLGNMSYLHTLYAPHSVHHLVVTRGSCDVELVICRGPQPLTGRSMWPFYCDTLLLLFIDPSFGMDLQRSLPHLLMALRLRQRVWRWGWGRKGWWVVATGTRSRGSWGVIAEEVSYGVVTSCMSCLLVPHVVYAQRALACPHRPWC